MLAVFIDNGAILRHIYRLIDLRERERERHGTGNSITVSIIMVPIDCQVAQPDNDEYADRDVVGVCREQTDRRIGGYIEILL